jgi:hypothetical protein
MQAFAVRHDTETSELLVAPAGFGVLCMVQLVPFQLSASVRVTAAVEYSPTAVQALAVRHETPTSRLAVAPLGSLMLWTVQVEPLRPSASGCCPLASVKLPTATQMVALAQETPPRSASVVPEGLGVVC